MKIEDFEITPEQEKAFNKVIKAIKEAKKTGIDFYAKNNSLYAYQRKAMIHAAPLHLVSRFDYESPIPCIFSRVIADSGADEDYFFENGFITE